MARVRTQEDFLKKAVEIHGDKYDYSKTKYVKSSEKVCITCPEHGDFWITPNKHLAGQGCNQCGINRTKVGRDEFIRRARLIHGNRYDYSQVVYRRKDAKVTIICPDHGPFEQTPHCHTTLGQSCPKCAAEARSVRILGRYNPMKRKLARVKARRTNLKLYGAPTWAESEIGRQRLHDIAISEDVAGKMKATCQKLYGADTWAQSDEGRQKLHEIMSSEEMRARVKDGYVSAYGVDHYMKTDEGREKARSEISKPEHREKIRQAFYEKYGAFSFVESESFKDRVDIFVKKSWQTKRRNGTFNTSAPEVTAAALLNDVFGADNVLTQYVDECRYPFRCDFYVKPLDLFIELNVHWSHGGHWFDSDNESDLKRLAELEEKSRRKGSAYYQNAIDVWTRRDLAKRDVAIKNNLNYLVFWQRNLSDMRDWLTSVGLML